MCKGQFVDKMRIVNSERSWRTINMRIHMNQSSDSMLDIETGNIQQGDFTCIARDVKLGRNVKIYAFVNLYGCSIGDETKIGTFVEIQKGVTIGSRVKVSSHSFLCEGVTIEDNVFIGHGVIFTNDRFPRATTLEGELQTEADWDIIPTVVQSGASIGSNATILCGVRIGEGAIVGAGSVVTRDVPSHTIVAGNPARVIRKIHPG